MPTRLRPYLLSLVLLTIAAFLGMMLAGEWFYLKHNQLVNNRIRSTSPPQGTEDELLPDNFSLPGVSEYQQMVERPLFVESRRPNQPPPAASLPPQKPEPPGPINFKVMGILSTPEGKMALMADAKGKYKRMKIRDAIDGWQIAEINPDRVLLEQNGVKQDVSLLKKRPKGAPPPNQGIIAPQIPAQGQARPAAPVPVLVAPQQPNIQTQAVTPLSQTPEEEDAPPDPIDENPVENPEDSASPDE